MLIDAIKNECNNYHSKGKFDYITEYLGYLPYGQYQWLEIKGITILEIIKIDWDLNDLKMLNKHNVIELLAEEKFGEDKIVIHYKINDYYKVTK